MGSSYPGALDSLPNPTSTTPLDSSTAGLAHHTQHANANDAIEAIQATLGVNPQGSEATVAARLAVIAAAAAAGGTAQVFLTSGTWTKPAGCSWVRIFAVAHGGPGGGGSRTGAGIVSRGGGGGSSGCMLDITLPADVLPSTMAINPGTAGTPGAGASTDNAAGGFGTNPTDVTIGTILRVKAGLAGGADSASGTGVTNGGLIGGTLISSGGGGAGYNGVSTGTVGTVSSFCPTPGGGGGGLSSSNVLFSGGAGGLMSSTFNNVLNTPAAAAGGLSSSPGSAGAAGSVFGGVGFGGGGGAPGNAAGTIAGGNGGAGGFPGGGGGGGGGSRNGVNGGTGGAGGAAVVIIVSV